MTKAQRGIVYEPDRLTQRKQVALSGAVTELVQVPPVSHAFSHLSASHLLMFTERGTRSDGESKAEGMLTSTMRDTSGTFSLIPAGVGYGGWTIPTLPARYLSLALDPQSPLLQMLPNIDDLWRAPIVYERRMPDEINVTLAKLRRAVADFDQYGQLYGESLLTVLMIELGRWLSQPAPVEPVRGGLTPRQVRLACDFIEAHCCRDLSLATLAALCDLSPNHFAKAFRISVGIPPHQYQLRCRIERAKTLLAHSDIKVIDIALHTGFATPSAFAASFRRATGLTPRDFRRSLT